MVVLNCFALRIGLRRGHAVAVELSIWKWQMGVEEALQNRSLILRSWRLVSE